MNTPSLRPDIASLINRQNTTGTLPVFAFEVQTKIQKIYHVDEFVADRLKDASLSNRQYVYCPLTKTQSTSADIIEKYKDATLSDIVARKCLREKAIQQINRDITSQKISESEAQAIIQNLTAEENDIDLFLDFFRNILCEIERYEYKTYRPLNAWREQSVSHS